MGIAAVLRGVPLLAFPGPARHHSNAVAGGEGVQDQLGGVLGGGGGGGGYVALPLDVMARAGVREEDVLREGAGARGLREAVFEVAVRASDHLITAREMVRGVMAGSSLAVADERKGAEEEEGEGRGVSGREGKEGKEERKRREVLDAFGVFMPAVACQMWLDRLQGVDFDVFREEVRRREWRLGWKAYWAFRRKMF